MVAFAVMLSGITSASTPSRAFGGDYLGEFVDLPIVLVAFAFMLLVAVLGGAGLAFYALIGFEDSVNVAEEAKDPERNYPRALYGGLFIAGCLYLIVSALPRWACRRTRCRAPTARCWRSCRSGRSP
jgi:basic amino acid/polyamine antiporter, APA family